MGKIRKAITLAGLTLASFLPKTQADPIEFTVSNVSELHDALMYNESSAVQTRIFLEDGEYSIAGNFPSDVLLIRNEEVVGLSNPIKQIPIDGLNNLREPNENSAHITNCYSILMGDNSVLSNIRYSGYLQAIDYTYNGRADHNLENVLLNNNYLERLEEGQFTVLVWDDTIKNINFLGNVISSNNGKAVGVYPGMKGGIPIFRENIFHGSNVGVVMQNLESADFGTIESEGENIFLRNGYNLQVVEPIEQNSIETSTTIPAQYNLWSDPEGNWLETEQNILETIVVSSTPLSLRNSQTNVIVSPFYSSLNQPKIATFSDTQTANSQSGNWNGILIWDEHEGLVGWKNGFGNVSMPYEFTNNSWKWINHFDFGYGGWINQTVNYRNKVAENGVSTLPKRSLVGTTQGYDIESDDFHYVCIRDMATNFNDVRFGSGNWTVEIPKSDSFVGVGIYCPRFEGWSDIIYTK